MKQRKEGKKSSNLPLGNSQDQKLTKSRNRPSKIPRSTPSPPKVLPSEIKSSSGSSSKSSTSRDNIWSSSKSLTPRENCFWDMAQFGAKSPALEPEGIPAPTGSPQPFRIAHGSPAEVRKRKLQPAEKLQPGRNSLNPSDAKKPFLEPSPERLTPTVQKSQIPRRVANHGVAGKRGVSQERETLPGNSRILTLSPPREVYQEKPKSLVKKIKANNTSSPTIDNWLGQYQNWSDHDQKIALKKLIDLAAPNHVRYMREVIEPRFQRDFISLLPRELALHVLSNLNPFDLMGCAQTCRTWRQLADDNLLWRQKCYEENITDCTKIIRKNFHTWESRQGPKSEDSGEISGLNHHSPWKAAYLRKKRIEQAWQSANVRPRELVGHDDHVVTCLQFDGNRIVSGSDDNTLKVWDAESGFCSATLTGHTGGVWCLEMKDDLIVSGSTDRTLKVWRADTGECIETLYGHASTVRCMAMFGNEVVSGSRDNTLRLWDITTFECKTVLIGHLAAVRCVCFDGKKVVSGSYDNTVKIWDPLKPSGSKLLFTLQGHQQRVYSLQFDGTHVVSGSLDTNIMVWDANTGLMLHTLTGHQSLTSGMELRDNTLVSGNADSTVKIWDIATGYLIRTLEGKFKHESAVTSLQYNGRFIITSSDDGTVKLWSAETGRQIRDLVSLDSRRNGGVVWRIKASETKLVCAVGSRNGTEITKLLVLDFDEINENQDTRKEIMPPYGHDAEDVALVNVNPT